jgi:hypothetical protein
MKRVLAILLFVSLAASGADLSGVWKLTYITENGHQRESKLELKVEGDSLTGTFSSERGTARIESGKINGDEITFDLVRKSNNDEITVHFKGKVEGGAMKLTMQFGQRAPVAIVGTKGS